VVKSAKPMCASPPTTTKDMPSYVRQAEHYEITRSNELSPHMLFERHIARSDHQLAVIWRHGHGPGCRLNNARLYLASVDLHKSQIGSNLKLQLPRLPSLEARIRMRPPLCASSSIAVKDAIRKGKDPPPVGYKTITEPPKRIERHPIKPSTN
jgi:hypothetical protein